MSWIQTYTGKRFDLLHPTVDQISLMDIAIALSRIQRWNGHLTESWTVLEHSMACAKLCAKLTNDAQLVLTALLHDAQEAYIGDIVSPLKQQLSNIKTIEERIAKTISVAFSTIHPFPELITRVDYIILATEAEYLGNHKPIDNWHLKFATPCGASIIYENRGATMHDFIHEVNKWHELSTRQRVNRLKVKSFTICTTD